MEIKDITNIKIKHIHPHADNPRKDLGDLTELSESIRKNGIMQNLTVIPIKDQPGEYATIIGHRRCAAARLVGVEYLPCRIIEEMSEKEQVSTMLEENMQRNDLTIYEQAQGFQMMLNLGETEEAIAEKTGFSKTTVRHRLNIAKLDQEQLKKKESDDNFQLTLKDLYELEKVEDIKTRDKILKNATSSRDITWQAQRAVGDAKKEKKVKKIGEALESQGVKKASKQAEKERWSGKWKEVKNIYIDTEFDKIELPEGTEQMYYYQDYSFIRIVTKNVESNQSKELTKEEQERRRLDKNKKEINTRKEGIDANRKEFIQNIISGKIKGVEAEEKIKDKIWKVLAKVEGKVSEEQMREFITGKRYWEHTDKEEKESQATVNKLSCVHQMLMVMNGVMNRQNICNWNGYYEEKNGEHQKHAYNILEEYGWSFADVDEEKIIDGTHELYTKKETINE